MRFKPLPPGLAQKLIEGSVDELSSLASQRLSRITAMRCPRCGSGMKPLLYAPAVFSADDPLPRNVANCPECGSIIDPITGIVLDTGDSRKIDDSMPMAIRRQPDND